jgi:rRNA maturation endonuclease Nob1
MDNHPYQNGWKYCRLDEKWFRTEKGFCPDCGHKLRLKSRQPKR